MIKNIILFYTLFFSTINLLAQDIRIRDNIDKDSLFNASIKDYPIEMREEYTKMYREENDGTKEFILFMLSMPKSSKKELIANYEIKKDEIFRLKNEFKKYVPANYVVDIEFEPESKIYTIPEKLSIKIYSVNANTDSKIDKDEAAPISNVISENWNLKPGSTELDSLIKTLNWTDQTLSEIKALLENANCISVKNGEQTTIGFARSNMGKYFYLVFDEPINSEEKEKYTNGCDYIYYNENVVLQYGGGAIGPQCFEKE